MNEMVKLKTFLGNGYNNMHFTPRQLLQYVSSVICIQVVFLLSSVETYISLPAETCFNTINIPCCAFGVSKFKDYLVLFILYTERFKTQKWKIGLEFIFRISSVTEYVCVRLI